MVAHVLAGQAPDGPISSRCQCSMAGGRVRPSTSSGWLAFIKQVDGPPTTFDLFSLHCRVDLFINALLVFFWLASSTHFLPFCFHSDSPAPVAAGGKSSLNQSCPSSTYLASGELRLKPSHRTRPFPLASDGATSDFIAAYCDESLNKRIVKVLALLFMCKTFKRSLSLTFIYVRSITIIETYYCFT